MNEENQVYFVDSDKLPEEALKRNTAWSRILRSAQTIWNIWKEWK